MAASQEPNNAAPATAAKRKHCCTPDPFLAPEHPEQEEYGRGCRKRCKTKKAEEMIDVTSPNSQIENVASTAAPSTSLPKIKLFANKTGEAATSVVTEPPNAASKSAKVQEPVQAKQKIKLNLKPSVPDPMFEARNRQATENALLILAIRGTPVTGAANLTPHIQPTSVEALAQNNTATNKTATRALAIHSKATAAPTPQPAPAQTTLPVRGPQKKQASTAPAARTRAAAATPTPAAQPTTPAFHPNTGSAQTSQDAAQQHFHVNIASNTTTLARPALRKINAAEHPVQHLIKYLENMQFPPEDFNTLRTSFLVMHRNNDLARLRDSTIEIRQKKRLVKDWWKINRSDPWAAAWKEFSINWRMKRDNLSRATVLRQMAQEARDARHNRKMKQATDERLRQERKIQTRRTAYKQRQKSLMAEYKRHDQIEEKKEELRTAFHAHAYETRKAAAALLSLASDRRPWAERKATEEYRRTEVAVYRAIMVSYHRIGLELAEEGQNMESDTQTTINAASDSEIGE